ncbi:ABC transporter ATP-binding protein [Micromonospora sp. WMMD1102]|uniref:ABC transporter ATP-binding protein n=1 Tax=Micromonospora sp. WMMD1102 TaxID=3016105 RepID=UPI002414E56A|nr:ABC transporter ATP-binding protein [Micromonospora sp. WMMD1102]MDG4786776.1 ABC transporter ATP-binding protein [Micromonospora sp. WMMD1102]
MVETVRGCLELVRLSWRQRPAKLILAVLLKLAEAAALPLVAAALGALTDAVLDGDRPAAVFAGCAAATATVAALTLGHFAHIAYFELGEVNLLTKDRQLIDVVTGSASIEHHERPDYADRMQTLTQEMQRVGWRSMESLLSGLGTAVAVTVTAVLLARLHPALLLLPLAAVPPMLLGQRAELLLSRARDATAESARRARHLFDLATDPGAAKELRVSGMTAELRRRHDTLWRSTVGRLWPAEVRAALLRVAGQTCFALGYAGAALLVLRDAVAGRRSVGDVVLVIALAALVNQQVSAMVGLLRDLQRVSLALAGFRWLRELVTRAPRPAPDAAVPARLRDGIRLREVGFDYPGTDRTVADGVDVLLPAGATVALVGENGAGKTTLVKLLCRMYEPDRGRIEADGVDIARFPLDDWRARIAVGFQDFVRLELAARQAVGVGDLPLVDSEEAVLAALDRAEAAELVEELDRGLDTPLGLSNRNGRQLSGGQWQKIALGRAMMRPAPLLLVLDEPTAALDAEAEHRLFARYAASAGRAAASTGAITVLVSHRFSTVRMADLILVLSGGRLVEAGDHDQLMAAGGFYAELYAIQARSYR